MSGQSKNIIEFMLFYNRYKKRVYNYALRMTSDKQLTEDIVQNVFLSFFENMNGIKNRDSISYWIFKTARNEIYSHFRKMKITRKNFIESDDDNFNPKSDYDLPALYELKELKNIVLSMLDELPEKQREVYLLREYGGLSYDEISKVTETEVKTVKSRLYKTRQKLIKLLSKVI